MSKNYEDSRPNPERLLRIAEQENRGKHTIFLGPIAGVGKTWAMLQAAQERFREGEDVAVGWVQLHGRKETEALLEGLEILPRLGIEHRGKNYEEMDLVGILQRAPRLVIVDELAHSNVEGVLHSRRYQDVEELLHAGIDVYSTLNIQHVESVNDLVEIITGVKVRETVPDYILEQAASIRLVDIPPDELLKRLAEGKIYVPERIKAAAENFFREGNINALREIALRYVARKLDYDLSDYMQDHKIEGPWPASGKIMVCVGDTPGNATMIRVAKRMADGLRGELLAVHIESGRYKKALSEPQKLQLLANLKLAEELGAETLTVVGDDFVKEVIDIALSNNATTIIIGYASLRWWQRYLPSQLTTADRLLESTEGAFNVYVVNTKPNKSQVTPKVTTKLVDVQNGKWSYVWTAAIIALVTLGGEYLKSDMDFANIAFLYLIPILCAAFLWGTREEIFATIISALCFDYFFVEPLHRFDVNDFKQLWVVALMFLLAFLVGIRVESIRGEARTARRREQETRMLYSFSKSFVYWHTKNEVVDSLAKFAGEALNREIMVLKVINGSIEPGAFFSPRLGTISHRFAIEDADMGIAHWVYSHNEAAGAFTDNLPSSNNLFLPMPTVDEVVGVFVIRMDNKGLNPVESRILVALAGMAALAMGKLAEDYR